MSFEEVDVTILTTQPSVDPLPPDIPKETARPNQVSVVDDFVTVVILLPLRRVYISQLLGKVDEQKQVSALASAAGAGGGSIFVGENGLPNPI